MKITPYTCLFVVFSLLFSIVLRAQYRNYTLVYTGDAHGSIVMFGNTLMNIVDSNEVNVAKMNHNRQDGVSIYGNDLANMQYTDIDGNAGSGSRTRNSSTADLVLPAGVNNIKLARLYWGGRVKTGDYDLTEPANQKIVLRKGTSAFYAEFTADQIDKNIFLQDSIEYARYQAVTDITSFMQINGEGTYSAGNAPLSTGSIASGGNYGGWCIVVVFENPSLHFNSLRLYDGFQQVFDSGGLLTTSITLTGLNVPPGTLETQDAQMGVVAWEGDANLEGDFLKINDSLFSNGINPSNNPWNGTISNNGNHITTKNPNFSNQMGIDIDQFYAGSGYGIMPNDQGALLEFGTEADQYFPGIVSFVVKSVAAPLPVSLTHLTGRLISRNAAKIQWRTVMGLNGAHFIVQRSINGNSFFDVASLPANGTLSSHHDYAIVDDISGITSPIIYYRVKKIDLDKREDHSRIISLKPAADPARLLGWPNPFKNDLTLSVVWSGNENGVLNVLDGIGKKLFSQMIAFTNGDNLIKVPDLQLLSPGSYIIELVSKNKRLTCKIVKQ